ncbi:MAG TPA: L-seryl-tRNA(Sec) selenium transferase [Candidatus Wallbacteria bacterium]|nr:L-seryl-tRNA(Sec) selenium transferase [Candidatus Wallbacteria bacterium]
MSANQSNCGFVDYLKHIPSKSLSLEFIKSNGGDFFNAAGERLVLSLLDDALEECRREILLGVYPAESLTRDFLCAEVWRILKSDYDEKVSSALSLVNVINATGIVIHTNLGRAPLGKAFAGYDRSRYSNLEFDLETGLRGRRDEHLKGLLTAVTGAEDAICVNNNAAAVLLVSAALAAGGEVMVRRGESVEIGEGFRINEMIKAGGARVADIGATNSCALYDYENALTPETKIAARIHTSNYRVSGYVKSFADEDFIEFCRRSSVVSYFDLGSGFLGGEILVNEELSAGEPSVRSLINAGFDLVSFSCDKLLGSSQAGVICGKKDLVALLRKHQMYRALRVSKDIIASLQQTLAALLFSNRAESVPVIKMLNESPESIGARCMALFSEISRLASYKTAVVEENKIKVEILSAKAAAGGGTTPEKTLSNPALHIKLDGGAPKNLTLEYIARFMRMSPERVAGYIDSDSYILNLRTVFDDETPKIARALDSLMTKICEK